MPDKVARLWFVLVKGTGARFSKRRGTVFVQARTEDGSVAD